MKLPTNFSLASLPAPLISNLRETAMQVNRLSDALPYVQQVSTGSSNNVARLLTSTATLDFPSISAGAVDVLTITVTGAAVGDFVTLAPPAALSAGLMFAGFVSAADTVTVRLHNTTGGAIDPASAVWGALVLGLSS